MNFTIEKGKNNKIKNLEANEEFIKTQENIFVEACQDNEKTINHYKKSRMAQFVGGCLTIAGAGMLALVANDNSVSDIAASTAIMGSGVCAAAVGTINKIVDRYILLNDAKVETISKNYDKIGVECSHDDIVDDMVK